MSYPLLEETGWSYSGISDAIRELNVDPHRLLCETNSAYQDALESQTKIERELEKVKTQRAYAVSAFMHIAQVLQKDKLCFVDAEQKLAVVVDLAKRGENKIDYEAYEMNVDPFPEL